MKIAITSIQRDRAPWIVEWLAFHLMVGFNQFYLYCHRCEDETADILLKLSRHYPIVVHTITAVDIDRPQLRVYQHAWDANNAEVDWMAFIDGDEFLFPTASPSMADALAPYDKHDLSALGVYWICYGSSGHIEEPAGLIVENYRRHSARSFSPNYHIKSIVRGRQEQVFAVGSHLFATPRGTYDEQLRLMTRPYSDESTVPSYDTFRINHYLTQSYEYFVKTKQQMPMADLNSSSLRPLEWFHWHDRNECDDGVSYNFLVKLKLKVRELQSCLADA